MSGSKSDGLPLRQVRTSMGPAYSDSIHPFERHRCRERERPRCSSAPQTARQPRRPAIAVATVLRGGYPGARSDLQRALLQPLCVKSLWPTISPHRPPLCPPPSRPTCSCTLPHRNPVNAPYSHAIRKILSYHGGLGIF